MHNSMDTIAAISTAVSNSGIGIIRISGSSALEVINRVFKPENANKDIRNVDSNTIHYGYIMESSKVLDEVLIMVMKAPNTFTREDVVEINCHGGVYIVKRILELVFRNGARPAEPGEFTKRAFLNGRIDLSQAEAVIDVINAKNEFALNSSVSQLQGAVSDEIRGMREQILDQIAFIEAALDDPEHISIRNYGQELYGIISDLRDRLNKLIQSFHNGRIRKEGAKTVILGKPNAGKSSLLNLILGEERAIVTEVAGTTRDTLEESINLRGISLNLVDTAGIRNTEDIVEKIGVDRAYVNAEEADLIIYVVDGSVILDENDYEIIELIKEKNAVVLLNKTDLKLSVRKEELEKLTEKEVVLISAKEHTGFVEFENKVEQLFTDNEISYNDQVYITNARHKNALVQAEDSLTMVEESIHKQMPEDFFSIDLMSAYEALGTVLGESIGDDLVNQIFSKFCMGK